MTDALNGQFKPTSSKPIRGFPMNCSNVDSVSDVIGALGGVLIIWTLVLTFCIQVFRGKA